MAEKQRLLSSSAPWSYFSQSYILNPRIHFEIYEFQKRVGKKHPFWPVNFWGMAIRVQQFKRPKSLEELENNFSLSSSKVILSILE